MALTAAQHGIADALRLWPRGRAFVLAEYLTVRGPVDPRRWAAAVRRMITDTEAQRIRLIHTASGPRQVVDPADRVPVTVVDLSGSAAPEAAARASMDDDLRGPCDPYTGSTAAHLVLITGPDTLLWYHRAHHVALDGYGFAQCARRVAEHYRALCGGAPVPPPPRGLAEVLAEDHAYSESARHPADGRYWHSVLPNRSAPTPAARPAAPVAAPLRTRRALALRPPSAGARYGIGESVLAAVAVHLSRHLGKREVVLGVPMMNRIGSVAATVPAMVLNAVAVPVTVDPADTVAGLAGRIGQFLAHARRHSRYRHERLRAELGLIGAGRSLLGPIVNIMPFDYDFGLAGIEVTARNLSAGPVEDLSINLYLRGGTAELVVDANPGRYRAAELEAHTDAVARTIEAVAADGTTTIADLGIDYVLLQSPRTAIAGEPMELFAGQVRADPDAPALIDGDRVSTRGELLAAATTRAQTLRAHGVRAGDLVAVVPGGEPDDIVTVLGIAVAGAAHAALDTALPDDELRALAAALAPAALVYDRRHPPRADLGLASIATSPENVPAHSGTADSLPAGAGYAVLTSGSTGRPEAVRVGGGALAVFVTDALRRYRWRPADRVVQFAPLHADTSVEEIFVTLAAGAALVTARAVDRRSLTALLGLAARTGATVLDLPTAIWHELAVALGSGTVAIPSTVRMIVIGGEEASPQLVARWYRHGGPPLHNSYGPSEAAIVCASADLVPGTVAPVPLGRLFPGIGAVLAVDRLAAETGDRCGVLHLYGPMLADGHLPAHAGDGFREIPLGGKAVRAFATGDRVRVREDGVLEFLERTDGTMKIGGRRIAAPTIEDLLRGRSGIRDAMITRSGEFAFDALVTVTGPRPAGWAAAVRQRLAGQLPHDWVPARVRVVDALPRTRNLKADRRAAVADGPAPTAGIRCVLDVFAGILGRDDLGPDDDFFAAGGTSMQTVALANRLTIALGAPVTVDDVLARPTAAELALLPCPVRDAAPGSVVETPRRERRAGSDPEAEPVRRKPGRGCGGMAGPPSREPEDRPDRTAGPLCHEPIGGSDPAAGSPHRVRDDGPDLAAECAALRTRLAGTPPAPVTAGPVLLTGATGFLGAYLLAELLNAAPADIVVPVRAENIEHARHRLRSAFTAIGEPEVFDRAWQSGRVRAVACDLTELDDHPWAFGTPSRIVHSAAEISAVRSYRGLRAGNVAPTMALLRLARAAGAALTLISTATAAGPRGTLSDPCTLPTGYAQSKSVAEHLLATAAGEFDLAVTIARPGRVLPHPADRRGGRGDFLHDLVAAVAAVGKVPRTTLREPVIRADDLARLVLAPAPAPPARMPRILDFFGPEPIAIADVLGALTAAPPVPPAQWRELVAACGELPAPRRAAVLRWCDIQLAGFDHDWISDHSVPVPARSATEVAGLLGLTLE